MRLTRLPAFIYGVLCYLAFLAVFAYTIAFVGDFLVPKTIDTGAELDIWKALLIDGALIALFGVQHSVMARGWFKRWWTRAVPEPIERSTYVLFSAVALGAVVAFWVPIADTLWLVEAPWARGVLWGVFGLGWALVVVTTELLDHRQLFGLRQVWAYLHDDELDDLGFATPGLYRWVRHPLMFGFLLAFWATPHMTVGHLVFTLGMTGYIIVGTAVEERDLLAKFGGRYRRYRDKVPMIVPGFGPAIDSEAEVDAEPEPGT